MSTSTLSKIGKTVVVGASALAMTSITTPAHAALYATGSFSYSQNGVNVCSETYVNTFVGVTGCSVSLAIGSFSIVLPGYGSCSGVADAVMTISSPSTPGAPSPVGSFVVTNGVGKFSGSATDGLRVAIGEAYVVSDCQPDVLDLLDTFSGKYELHA